MIIYNSNRFSAPNSPITMFEPELYNQSNVYFCQRQFWISHSLVNSNQLNKLTNTRTPCTKVPTDSDKSQDMDALPECTPLATGALEAPQKATGLTKWKGGSFPELHVSHPSIWGLSCHKLNWYHNTQIFLHLILNKQTKKKIKTKNICVRKMKNHRHLPETSEHT